MLQESGREPNSILSRAVIWQVQTPKEIPNRQEGGDEPWQEGNPRGSSAEASHAV